MKPVKKKEKQLKDARKRTLLRCLTDLAISFTNL